MILIQIGCGKNASCELRVAVASCELLAASCPLRWKRWDWVICELRVASCELRVLDPVPQQYYLTVFSKL